MSDGRKARAESPAAASLGISLSEQAASGANDILSESVAALQGRNMGGQQENIDDTIMNPNGQRVRLTQMIDHDYFAEDHTSIFAKDPKEYMKDPNPDALYVWPAKNDPQLFARVRAGAYRPVATTELRDDCALPVTTHTVPGIQDENGTPQRLVAVYDLCLMEVQPKAVKKLYKFPAFQAALRTKQNLPFENLRRVIEQESRGAATAVLEKRVDV